MREPHRYKPGQIIHYFDAEWVNTGDPLVSNMIDDFMGKIVKTYDEKIIVQVLSVNTKDAKGRWRPTIMRTLGAEVTLYLASDAQWIHLTEMSEILYG